MARSGALYVLPLLHHLFLARNGLLWSLAGSSVGVSALATNWQTATMAQTLVAADFHFALDVLLHFAAKVTLDAEVAFDVSAEFGDVLVAEVTNPNTLVDLACCENL